MSAPTRNLRLVIFVCVATLSLLGAAAFAAVEWRKYQARDDAAPTVAHTAPDAYADVPRLLFRNTVIGSAYGTVAAVPLSDPDAPRALSDVACDRIDATATRASCLRTKRGVVTRYEWLDLDDRLEVLHREALAGIPNRTRLSEDGRLAASTVFVTGHSYMQVGFSTTTVIREVGGRSHGNLERFALRIDGEEVKPADRNVWGVTFADDGRTFYATVATGGRTHLVRGDLEDRTLTSIHSPLECPSLSPDGTRIAYKLNTSDGATAHWVPAVLDLDSQQVIVLEGEERSVDDQIEWLDDDTVLYGLARPDEPGRSDVWALDTRPDARPQLFLENAWSPAVVRG